MSRGVERAKRFPAQIKRIEAIKRDDDIDDIFDDDVIDKKKRK